MKNIIIFDNKEFLILKKRIKNIYIRYQDSKITVSVPIYASKKDILKFISDNIEKINIFIEKRINDEKKESLENGSSIGFFGEKLYITVKPPISKNKVYKEGSHLIFECENTKEEKEELLNKFYRQELSKILPMYIEKWSNITGIVPNEVRIKNMKTRWGSCNCKEKRIWISTKIMSKDKICLDYLILHELSHIIIKGHNKDFKLQLEKYMPEYRKIEKMLNGS